jgi:hypothetical protein
MRINNVFTHGTIEYSTGKSVSKQLRGTKLSFHGNTLCLTSTSTFTLSITKFFYELLVVGKLQRIAKRFLIKRLKNKKIGKVKIKVVNININLTIKGNKHLILKDIIPYIHRQFVINTISVAQESNAFCPIRIDSILNPCAEFGFIALSLRTIGKTCNIKFQTNRKQTKVFISVIVRAFKRETEQLISFLDSFA